MIDVNNKKFWNIVKGIGILSVVIGHCCSFLVPFVYLFHLTIFFFVGGYLYSEGKYGDSPYSLLVSRLKSSWKKYVLFGIFFILIHNLLFKCGMIVDTKYYDFDQTFISIFNTLLFFGTETMGGALWFIPMYIFSSVLFGTIVYYSRKFSSNNIHSKNINILILSVISGIFGSYFVGKNIDLMLHIQTSFLVIPIFAFGYFVRNNIIDLSKYLKFILFIPVTLFLVFVAYKTNYFINLSFNVIGNPLKFFLVSFVGIYFCLYLSKLIIKVKLLSNCFSLMGIYSFEIMACHFLVFKIIDFVFSINVILKSGVNPGLYGKFPYAYGFLWPIYIILGVFLPVLFCLILKHYDNNNIKNKIINLFNNNKFKIIFLILLVICIGLPIVRLGIMHNDELMSRFWSSQGFFEFYKHYFYEQLEKGRALSSFIIPFTMYLGFIGQNTLSFKFFQLLSIVLCVYFFIKLLKRIFKNNKMTILYSILFLAFLPISFEPTVPNVFVTFYNVSICLLLYSFCLYVDYLDTYKTKKLVASMIIFFLVELTYEAFITYVPIFLLLYVYKNGFKKIFKDLKAIILPISCGVLYLILYVLFTKLFPSNYAGNQIDGLNIIKSLEIVFKLGYYTLPGSYLTSDKYRWLFSHYFKFNIYDLIRIIIFTIVFVCLYVSGMFKKKDYQISRASLLKIFFIGVCLIVLPILPISVASMYQSMKVGVVTLGLPVSFFSYFGSILILTGLVLYISYRNSLIKRLVFLLITILVICVQSMNGVFSRVANEDFKRIQMIEGIITSGLFDNIDEDIYAPDLFIVKDALFIHDSHWNDFAKYHNVKSNFINKTIKHDDNALYYYDSLGLFVFDYKHHSYIISVNELSDYSSDCIDESDDFTLSNDYKLYKFGKSCDRKIFERNL